MYSLAETTLLYDVEYIFFIFNIYDLHVYGLSNNNINFQILVAALKFFLGNDDEGESKNDSDSDSEVKVPVIIEYEY